MLYTGNSCRSQLLHGYLARELDERAAVYSADVEVHGLNLRAVRAMAEDGLDISTYTSNQVDEYAAIPFDYVITVCDHANEVCPVLPSTAKKLPHNFPDPTKATGTATFATEPPTWEAWEAGHLPTGHLVAADAAGQVLGWVALSPVSGRCVYASVAEVSVYVAATAQGHGVGRALMGALVRESEQNGLWTLQAGIFPENLASLRLHEAVGFRPVGRRERIGQRRGVWQDTMLLVRHSAVVGTADKVDS